VLSWHARCCADCSNSAARPAPDTGWPSSGCGTHDWAAWACSGCCLGKAMGREWILSTPVQSTPSPFSLLKAVSHHSDVNSAKQPSKRKVRLFLPGKPAIRKTL
jgi:hypothetical protein